MAIISEEFGDEFGDVHKRPLPGKGVEFSDGKQIAEGVEFSDVEGVEFSDEEGVDFSDEEQIAEGVNFSDDEGVEFSDDEGVDFSDEEQIAEGVDFSDEEQIAVGVEFSDEENSEEDNEDAPVPEELLKDHDSLVHEPLLGQCDEIWNEILEWPDLELNSISCGIEWPDSPDGAFSFSALKDRTHWDKLIYLQDKQPWDLENASGAYDEFEDLEYAAEALHHTDLPVPSSISSRLELQESGQDLEHAAEALHHTDLPAPSSISSRLELQESGHPCREYDGSLLFVDGDEDCLESSSSGDALNQECEALVIDDRLGHSRSDLRPAVLTELSLESTHPESQSLPADLSQSESQSLPADEDGALPMRS